MNFISKNWKGLLLCLALAVPASLLGKQFPIIGGSCICDSWRNDFCSACKKERVLCIRN